MYLLICLAFMVVLVWAFERFYLRGPRLDQYPLPVGPYAPEHFTHPGGSGPEQHAVKTTVKELTARITQAIVNKRMDTARATIDGISDGIDYVSRFLPADAGGIPAEWVIAPGADATRRMLYVHGGGFIMGSPKSHRTITSRFSEISGTSVLAVDYRLLPEHKHMDCVEDCRSAYQWLLENGPAGPGVAGQLYLGGDSAGGNLALSLAAWARDLGLRQPDAVVALSPLTDMSFSGATIRANETTDVMLAPILRDLNRLPQFIKSWWVVFNHRVRPANPVASPLLGDLSGLPPILVQASEAEMLLDDARRYAYKACASGSPVKLQTWEDMVHVWQIFDPQLPQAIEAWRQIDRFLQVNTPD